MSHSFTDAAVLLLTAQANRDTAGPMEAYMKNQFPFLGIKTPLRRELSKRLFREQGIPEDWDVVVRELWSLPEREYQYIALDLLEKVKKRFTPEHLELAEELITTKSWWDTVDYLASHTVGTLFRLYPTLILTSNEHWLEGSNMWLQRTALLFQLSYKDKTNQELLFNNIRFCVGSKEFFIQKAIGWSLREYAKTNPDAVRHFVEMTSMANLSRREALKHL
ncbi:DNA alkylation repair protein [Brevibacillus choshinensis]|uniref:DNA alkylation repair protein n=1 Tax=Brevibacillus choshinensis TaxID=54911 RepID=UPI002E1DDE13|nr:DNA alkylation repair protein [Brevibacillus choshinensis]